MGILFLGNLYLNLAYKNNQKINTELTTLQGMQANSDTEMMSDAYKNGLWTILAIVLVIGSIKLSK